LLREDIPPPPRTQLPTFVEGDRISGRTDFETIVEGSRRAAQGRHRHPRRPAGVQPAGRPGQGAGNVHINKAGNIFEGPLLELKVDAFEGFFNEPRYRFLRNDAYGEADRVDFIDDKRSSSATPPTPPASAGPGPSWMPDWILRAASHPLDQEEETGTAEGAC
jgi:LPS-assembly protein